jgi:hypothetical protein
MTSKPSRGGIVDNGIEQVVPKGVSHRALTIARLIDRRCRVPGEYTVKLIIPYHGRARWRIEVSRLEKIRSMEIDRKGKMT